MMTLVDTVYDVGQYDTDRQSIDLVYRMYTVYDIREYIDDLVYSMIPNRFIVLSKILTDRRHTKTVQRSSIQSMYIRYDCVQCIDLYRVQRDSWYKDIGYRQTDIENTGYTQITAGCRYIQVQRYYY